MKTTTRFGAAALLTVLLLGTAMQPIRPMTLPMLQPMPSRKRKPQTRMIRMPHA